VKNGGSGGRFGFGIVSSYGFGSYSYISRVMYSYVWLCMAMYGYVWLCIVMYGYVGLYKVMYGYVQVRVVAKENAYRLKSQVSRHGYNISFPIFNNALNEALPSLATTKFGEERN